jgi:hypothetical protein
MPTEEKPATPETQAPAAPEPEKPATPEPEKPGVVDVMGEDLAEVYPALKEIAEAEAKGLKFPTERKWLDEQMQDSRFRAFVHGLRGLATKEREVTVTTQKAVAAEREAVAAERRAVEQDRRGIQAELAKLADIVDRIPKAPATPAGGEPDPRDPNPKVQAYFAQKHVAAMFDPVRQRLGEVAAQEAKADQEAAVAAAKAANLAFIERTPDFLAYEQDVLAVIQKGEAATIDGAYHIAKARRVAEAPVVAKVAGPDLSTMTATELAVYELEHAGWKRPADWRERIKRSG